ncbi:Leucine rich repeat protein bspa family [Entamoeba marina]
MLIISKYLKSIQDFINVMCVCKKFKETTEKLKFNPIPITSLKLFPKIQTQYLYDEGDKKIKGVDNYEIWFSLAYENYLKIKGNNIKCHYVIYNKQNRMKYGDSIPNNVTILGDYCFGRTDIYKNNASNIEEINLPSSIISLSIGCFSGCKSIKSINLSSRLTSIGKYCFWGCSSLSSINLPTTLTSFGKSCFTFCSQLQNIQEVPEDCFNFSLIEI